MQQNDLFKACYHGWLDAMQQAFTYQNDFLKSKLDDRQIRDYHFPPVLQLADKQQMDTVAELYTHWLQCMYELLLNQLSIGSEWSERTAHMAARMNGIKTVDIYQQTS